MFRGIAAVIGGYLVIGVISVATFLAAYVAMGVERAFQPASFEISATWIALMVVVSLVAAFVGGCVAAWIARTPGPPRILAVVLLLFGLLAAMGTLRAKEEAPALRTSEVSALEAAGKARRPTWLVLATPLINTAGVLIGARARPRGRATQSLQHSEE